MPAYTTQNGQTYNLTKDIKSKTCDCADCRKQISMEPDNCIGFGLYVCESCRKEREIEQRMKKTTQHIGAAGELLVQYKLLKFGVDSAAMTTDSGIDIVAYSPKSMRSFTIQVKTKEKPTKGGGTGKLSLAWDLRDNSPAELVAIADLSTDSVWLFTHTEFEKMAQQHSGKGNLKLYMYVDESVNTKKEMALISQFDQYRLEERIDTFF